MAQEANGIRTARQIKQTPILQVDRDIEEREVHHLCDTVPIV